METRESGIVLGRIRTLFNEGRIGAMTDEQLLERFAARRAEAAEAAEAAEDAFEALVLRHGPMVLGVCRRVLRDPHEVEDAFQATFLILARRAGSIRRREVVGGWLCKVARRVAARARALSVRRLAVEANDPASSAEDPVAIVEREDLGAAVLDEIQLLPEKYRLPVQLCYIEGMTHDDAARQLRWPVGTVRTRLAWARDRLRARLSRRGIAVPAGFLGASLVSLKATAAVPAPLVKATVQAAAGRAVGAAAMSLATQVLRGILLSRLKLVIALVLAVGSVTGFALPLTRGQVGKAGPVAAQANGQEQPATDRDPRTVFFRVVDAGDRRPLAGVTLKLWVDGKMVRQHVTDGSGRMVIPLGEREPGRLTVTARGNGWVPKRVYLRHFAARETEIPRSYTLAMERGTTIGGIVRDEEGRPIEGATVSLYETSPDDRGREALDFDEVTPRTDARGRWQLDLIPAGLDLGHLHFTFTHPNFVRWIGAVNNQPILTPAQLRSRTGVIVLRKGLAVVGRVLDRDGRPIAGASVRLGDPFRQATAEVTDVRSDDDGRFRIGNTAERELPLTARAAGFGPELISVKVRPGLPPLELRLGPAHTIPGRVIDDAGQPVRGATVYVNRWRGHQTLDWRADTDADGRFRWDDAPVDAVSMGVFKQGYDGMTSRPEPPGKEVVLSLVPSRELRLRGTVTDAETGRPIETFTVVPGTEIGGPTLWNVDFAKEYHGGRYMISLSHLSLQPHRIRIEARGYLPVLSAVYRHDAGEKILDARLEKGDWIEGVVRGPRGNPLAGAEVVVATVQGISIDGGKTYQRAYHPHLLTGPDGRFAFAPPDGPCRIIALHDQGYGEASANLLAEARRLIVEPWGRIEGTLRVGGRPLPHEVVVATLDEERVDPDVMTIQNSSRAQTDDRGHFVIERVTPGEARVHWQPDARGRRPGPDRYYLAPFVDVPPGATVRVDLTQEGGPGLIGRVVAADGPSIRLDLAGSNAYLIPRIPEVPYPPGLDPRARREWLGRWRLTEAGKTYRRLRRGFGHTLHLQPDGSFRVDEIQPGAYVLHVRVKGYVELIRDVTIAEPDAGPVGVPVDLGVLPLTRPTDARNPAEGGVSVRHP